MRVLLIYSPYKYPHKYAIRTELLGITYLAASIRASGHDVSIFDPTINKPVKLEEGSFFYGAPDNVIRDEITRYRPDVIGISCQYVFSHYEALRIASMTKRIDPGIITVIGGLYPSIYKEKTLVDAAFLDYCLVGEAEKSFVDLLSALSGQISALEDVDGLIYRRGTEIVYNKKMCFIEDLDKIPYPARDLVDIRRYMTSGTELYGLGGRPTLSIITSRSCPYRCTFCNMWLVHGPRWRPRSPENVLGEIDEIVNKYHAEHVFFMDDNFTYDPERVKVICEKIIKKGLRFSWNTPNGISVKRIDAEMARLMKRAGCANVCIGVESGSEHIRNKVMKKRISNEEIEKAIVCFKAAKIPVGAFIILGMPGEDKHHFEKTVDFVKRLPLSFIATTFVVPSPGTKLYEELVGGGIIEEDAEFGMDNFNFPIFETADFTRQELLERRKRIFRSFYLSHILSIGREFVEGRLSWVGANMMKRFFVEKIFSH